MRRWAAVLAAAAVAAACTSPPGPPETAAGPDPAATASPGSDTTLRWAIGEPRAIVPPDATTPDDLLVVDAVFDSLTAWDADLAVVPAAAVRWTSDRDASRWTFTLRSGAAFSDGSPVTARDFVTAWNAAARDGAAAHHLRSVVGYADVRAGRRRTMAGVRAVDERTLRVALRHPWADFPAVVAHPALGPVPTAAWQRDRAAFRERPVGNGPFALAEPWAHDRFVRLTRVRPPGAEPPTGRAVTEVVFTLGPPDGAYVAFQQGRLDVATLPVGALTRVLRSAAGAAAGAGRPRLLRGHVASTYLLTFNLRRPPFDDPAVRRAVSQALRREAIVAENLEGNAVPARALVPPGVPGAAVTACPACEYDPASSRAAFAAAGVRKVALGFNADAGHETVAARVRRDLDAVGVDVSLRREPFADYRAALRGGAAGMFRFGWTLDYPTLDNALYPLLSSRASPRRGGANYGGYADRRIDALLRRARATLDPAARAARYRRAERLGVGRDQAVVPIMTYRSRLAVSARVRGLDVTPLGTVDLAAVRVRDDVARR